MPPRFLEKIKSENPLLSSIGVCLAGNILNIYDPSVAKEVFVCEFVNDGCRWQTVRNVVAGDRNRMKRLVFTSSKVGIDNVRKALRSQNRRFRPLPW
ncbi:hypothetical protein U1Q18_009550 [Sarracenia purpurea var. burkii]